MLLEELFDKIWKQSESLRIFVGFRSHVRDQHVHGDACRGANDCGVLMQRFGRRYQRYIRISWNIQKI